MFDIWPDKKWRPIRAGDIVRIYHFTGARRRKHYMYRFVILEEGRLVLMDPASLANKINKGVAPDEAIMFAFRHDIDVVNREHIEIVEEHCVYSSVPETGGIPDHSVQYACERPNIKQKYNDLFQP